MPDRQGFQRFTLQTQTGLHQTGLRNLVSKTTCKNLKGRLNSAIPNALTGGVLSCPCDGYVEERTIESHANYRS